MGAPLSFRMPAADRRSGASSPESITTIDAILAPLVVMDSGLAASPRPGMTEGTA